MLKKFLVWFIIISVVSYIFVEREIDTMVKWEMCQNYSPISNDLDKFYYCLNLIPEYENTIIFKLNKKNYINLGCSSQKPINKNLIIHNFTPSLKTKPLHLRILESDHANFK